MRCYLIAGMLLTAPATAAIKEIQAKVSGCKAVLQDSKLYLGNIERTPDKYKNIAETKHYLKAAIAEAEECIRTGQSKLDARFSDDAAVKASEDAAAEPGEEPPAAASNEKKPLTVKRLKPVSTAEPFHLRNTAIDTGFALIGISAYLFANMLSPATFPLAVGAAWGMCGGTVLAAASGFVADFNAFTDRSADERRYISGNRDDEFIRRHLESHGK